MRQRTPAVPVQLPLPLSTTRHLSRSFLSYFPLYYAVKHVLSSPPPLPFTPVTVQLNEYCYLRAF